MGASIRIFQKCFSDNPDANVVQIDTVIGRIGGKCLLTIHFVVTSLMLAFLRDSNTSASVIHIFNVLDQVLGTKRYGNLFRVILMDNGSEFSNLKVIEYRDNVTKLRSNVFYCDPSSPYQKRFL